VKFGVEIDRKHAHKTRMTRFYANCEHGVTANLTLILDQTVDRMDH